ncbi:MAG: MerR family transcriptional regulator, partial [Gammaproteobacteria bacterium]|nr:MerR family transcriptional regulator [Gammaproteobacteria bacterium]
EQKEQYEGFLEKESPGVTPEQKARVIALGGDFPRFWNDCETSAKDRKRILRLAVKDITLEKPIEKDRILLHIRWQGGVCETLCVENLSDHWKYSEKSVERIRRLARGHSDIQIAAILNDEGQSGCRGKPIKPSTIQCIRYKHRILLRNQKRDNELTVAEVARKFNVGTHVVQYWIERGLLKTRRLDGKTSPHWITLDSEKEKELLQRTEASSRTGNSKTHAGS